MEEKRKWLVYLNGTFVPEEEAKISIYDSGFKLGDSVFEVARTFNHKPFNLKEHLDRLANSLRYSGINAGLDMKELEKICLKVLEVNRHLIRKNEDVAISISITRGIYPSFADIFPNHKGATVIIDCRPIPFQEFAIFYKTGAHVVIPSRRHISPQSLDPKVKTRSRILFAMADIEATLIDKEAYPLLLDADGNITESTTANFFIVTKGILKTPPSRNILCGISRQIVLELARELGIPAEECPLQVYDVINADETFLTSTTKCILPVSYINNIKIQGKIPGPTTQKLLSLWSKKVGLDIVKQALSFVR